MLNLRPLPGGPALVLESPVFQVREKATCVEDPRQECDGGFLDEGGSRPGLSHGQFAGPGPSDRLDLVLAEVQGTPQVVGLDDGPLK